MWTKHAGDKGFKAPEDLIITKAGEDIHVAESIQTLNLKLEVLSEVLDEILEHTGISTMSIQERMEAKLMIKKLSS